MVAEFRGEPGLPGPAGGSGSGNPESVTSVPWYTLFMIPTAVEAKGIPVVGVRLNDRHVAIVLESGLFSKKQLNNNWKAELI